MSKEIKFESNMSIIFLTLLIIGIVIFMILEFKKINIRINKIVTIINEGKNMEYSNIQDRSDIVEDKNNIKERTNNEMNNEIDNNKNIETWRENNTKEEVINEINNTIEDDEEEYLEQGISNQFSSMVFSSRGFGFNEEGGQLDIEEISGSQDDDEDFNEGDINKEDIDEEYIYEGNIDDEEVDEGVNEEDTDEEKNSEGGITNENEIIDKYPIDVDEGEDEGEDESDDEEIDLKELEITEDFEKEKIIVDQSFSVNQLKQLCKNMGLSISGNKSLLISRIMDNQK